MQRKLYVVFAFLLMGLILGGCTGSFNPRIGSLPPPLSTAKDVRQGVEVSVEEFVSATKARMAFDADVAQHGILALLVRMENKGNKDYKAWKRSIKVSLDGEMLQPMPGYMAARQVASYGFATTALATIAAMPLGIFISPKSVSLIDKGIERHFERVEFADRLVKADEVVLGFVYFKLRGGSFGSKRLENLTVHVTLEEDTYGEQNSNPLYFTLTLPTLEVS